MSELNDFEVQGIRFRAPADFVPTNTSASFSTPLEKDADGKHVIRNNIIVERRVVPNGGDVQTYAGDFNERVADILATRGEREATFCLLDQRTFECQWATVQLLASHKAKKKIELFYLLADAWLGRALSATKDQEKPLAGSRLRPFLHI